MEERWIKSGETPQRLEGKEERLNTLVSIVLEKMMKRGCFLEFSMQSKIGEERSRLSLA